MENNRWFIVTNRGYIMTNDEKMSQMPFTIDDLIKDNSLIDDPNGPKHWIACVTKNGKTYWDSEVGYV